MKRLYYIQKILISHAIQLQKLKVSQYTYQVTMLSLKSTLNLHSSVDANNSPQYLKALIQ